MLKRCVVLVVALFFAHVGAAHAAGCGAQCSAYVEGVLRTWNDAVAVTQERIWYAGVVRFTPHAVCVREHESAHGFPWPNDQGYGAQNPVSSASGAYGFLDGTWDNVARARGRLDLVGLHAREAPFWEQDASYGWLAAREGDSPWSNRC